MKKGIMLIVMMLLAVGAASASAEARGYQCAFRVIASTPITIIIDGNDNSGVICRSVRAEMGKQVRSIRSPYAGGIRCAWDYSEADIRIAIRGTNALLTRSFCDGFADSLDLDWTRIR